MDADLTKGPSNESRAYFERVGLDRFRPTRFVGGAWNPAEQHVAPAMGLLAHVIELDRDRRGRADLRLTRATYEILGTIPIEICEVSVDVVRPGRTIELVEARLVHGGRLALIMRAWLLQPHETAPLATGGDMGIEPIAEMERWDPATIWDGEFVRTLDVRRHQIAPGRASCWVRSTIELVAGETVSPVARCLGLVDFANGLAPIADPRDAAFPNVDLTAHLFQEPRGEWVGLDTTVHVSPSGTGLTESRLYDAQGQVGTLAQALTVRPRN